MCWYVFQATQLVLKLDFYSRCRSEIRLCLPSSSMFSLWTLASTTCSWISSPVDVEGPLHAEIQATWFSKWQLFFVDLAIPMQANLEDTVEDDDTMCQKLLEQHADTSGPESTRSRISKGSKVNVPTFFRGQKASLCWWLCWLCCLNIRSGDRLRWNGLGLVLTSRSRSSRCSKRYGGWDYSRCCCWCYSCWNTSDMVSEA